MERETQMNAETSTYGEVVFAGNREECAAGGATSVTNITSTDGEVVIPEKREECVPRKAISVSKLGSKSSSCRRRAELKLQQAKRRHELERRERELERQRFELKQQIELQILEDKLAQSELDSCLSDSSSTHSSHQLPQETLDSETKVKDYISGLNTISNSQQAPETQQMGQLSVERLLLDKPPFTYVGVDFFGPMYVKSGRRQLK